MTVDEILQDILALAERLATPSATTLTYDATLLAHRVRELDDRMRSGEHPKRWNTTKWFELGYKDGFTWNLSDFESRVHLAECTDRWADAAIQMADRPCVFVQRLGIADTDEATSNYAVDEYNRGAHQGALDQWDIAHPRVPGAPSLADEVDAAIEMKQFES